MKEIIGGGEVQLRCRVIVFVTYTVLYEFVLMVYKFITLFFRNCPWSRAHCLFICIQGLCIPASTDLWTHEPMLAHARLAAAPDVGSSGPCVGRWCRMHVQYLI